MTNKIFTITDLLNTLLPVDIDEPIESIEPINAAPEIFYAHVDLQRYTIEAISSDSSTSDGRAAVQIDAEFAKKFLTGKENPIDWVVGKNGDVLELRKRERERIVYNKTEVQPIKEIKIVPLEKDYELPTADASLKVNRDNNTVELYYNGDIIGVVGKEIRIYFTREGDPSYLLYSLKLTNELLNSAAIGDEWPNPIVISIQSDDISIYAQNTGAKIQAYEEVTE